MNNNMYFDGFIMYIVGQDKSWNEQISANAPREEVPFKDGRPFVETNQNNQNLLMVDQTSSHSGVCVCFCSPCDQVRLG